MVVAFDYGREGPVFDLWIGRKKISYEKRTLTFRYFVPESYTVSKELEILCITYRQVK